MFKTIALVTCSLAVLAATTAVHQQPAGAGTPMAVVTRLFDAYRQLDADGMAAAMAPDLVFDDPTFRLHFTSRADWRKMAEESRKAITHIAIDTHSTLESGDAAAVEYTLSGGIKTKAGVRPFKVRCASFFRVAASHITRWTDYCDFRTFNEQTRHEP